jgi:ABC-type transport system substrate-binding protein
VSYFPSYLATFVWAVIDLEIVAESSTEFPLQDAGAGQWRFTEFVDNDHFTMEPNSEYWDGVSPSVSRITWPFMDSLDAASVGLEQYKADQLVSLDVPISLSSTIAEDQDLAADLVSIPSQGSTISIGLDFNQPPFNDVRIRQAIAAAVDSTAFANDIWQGYFVPATSFTPPSTVQLSGYTAPAGPTFDAARSADLVSQAEFQTGDAQTEIIYYQSASDSAEDQERHAALLQMIADNSGITITHDVTKTADQIASLQTDIGGRQFDIVWWWPVTDTPSLLSTVGQSTSPFMAGWFNWNADVEAVGDLDAGEASAEFDRISLEADQELDPDTRNSKYAEAEKILLDNAVYIPLGHWVQKYIQKPWLQGTRQGPWSGRIPVRIDKDVTVSGKPE